MSRRGGGRRSDSYGDDNTPSFQRGGRGSGRGRGRGRGGDGGRGRGGRGAGPAHGSDPASAATPAASPRPESSFPPLTSRAPPPVTFAAASPSAASSSTAPPAHAVQEAASSSSSVDRQSADFDKKLTLAGMSATTTAVSSSKARVPPRRPGFGTIGNKCIVKANHFLVQLEDKDLHHYDVTVRPEMPSKPKNRDVMSQLVEQYGASHLGGRKVAYDGMKSLYTAGRLPFESKEFVVKLLEKDGNAGSSKQARKERPFKVAIKFAAKVDVHHLQQFLRGRQLDLPQETIQVLDIVLRTPPSKVCIAVGRSFFSTSLGAPGELGDGLEYWRGYYQSLRPTQMGLSLNIDVSARAFYEPILVTNFIAKHFNLRETLRPLPDHDRAKVKKALKGIKVELTHRPRSYKITGISVEPLSQLIFTLDDERTQMSVVQYFLEKYNIRLKYTSLPAIQAGSESKPVFLPMELCRIAEGQRYSKKLNERQVTALLRATCQRPRDREKSIEQTVTRNRYSSDGLVKDEFGIQVEEELTFVDARVLPPPTLMYHKSGREAIANPQTGQWNMINKKMINGGRVEFWTCVNFSVRIHQDLPPEFCRQLIEMCSSKGMQFNPNPLIPIRSANPNQIEKVLVDTHKHSAAKLANQPGKQLQLLIIILPDISGSYGKIKRICETELGIVSQCCQPKQAARLSKQYFENVALKVNVKVGGRNNMLHGAVPLVTDRPTIIFGADVTHPQPGDDSNASIAAVVASMDWPEVTKYRGLVSAQAHREEIIQDLYKSYQDPKKGLVHAGMVRELLISFRRSTGHKPHRIIFYRDGVSEGQFNQVLLYEMDAIRKACRSLEEGYLPPVTFVVVQKRHHTRFFPAEHGNRDQTDKSGNIRPGTVVESKICHPTEFDFFLNSHAGIQGTSRPTHYHVLWDENRFTADQLQVLTNNLCYTYARCTRSVSIVPPAYYAHLAAFRAHYYTQGETSDGGSSSGRTMSGATLEVQPLPGIKDNVKDVMFYC